MKPLSLEELYTKACPVASAAALRWSTQRGNGHFDVFHVADLVRESYSRPPMTFNRRAFYNISLLHGPSRIEYADQAVEVTANTLWFATHRVPYRWVPHNTQQTGYFCIFTEEFMQPVKGGLALNELPVLQASGQPVLAVSDADYAAVAAIFQKMKYELNSDYVHKYDLLRSYLGELIHFGQKLQPPLGSLAAPTAAARLAAQFAELLEKQFSLASPPQYLRLRTATAYADQLAVHVNYLNRVLKGTTGYTTSALLNRRLAQEAKLRLKHTSWSVAQIADSLGFTDTAHFCHFFKRQTSLTPSDFRG